MIIIYGKASKENFKGKINLKNIPKINKINKCKY